MFLNCGFPIGIVLMGWGVIYELDGGDEDIATCLCGSGPACGGAGEIEDERTLLPRERTCSSIILTWINISCIGEACN